MKLKIRKYPVLDLEFNGIHLSRLPLTVFDSLFGEKSTMEARASAMASLFDTGALCDANGNKFEDFDFHRDIAGDFRVFEGLLTAVSKAVAALGKSSSDKIE